jgi:hypothetical protein
MRTFHLSTLLAVVLTVVGSGVLRADLTPSEIVAQFNNLGTNGWEFTSTGNAPRTFTSSIAAVPDLSAYVSGVFYSFSVDTNFMVAASGLAKLNYNATTGLTQNAAGTALSVGGAFLYQQYAQSELPNTVAELELAQTIRNLNSATTSTSSALNWGVNAALLYLLSINSDREYWVGNYNVNQRYDEIGDYAVFIMNITTSSGLTRQDHIYVARANYGTTPINAVPEPATVMIWMLGSVGALGMNTYRKRSGKA